MGFQAGCQGERVVNYVDGTFMRIDPFCDGEGTVQTSDMHWLCRDCALYHFGGWIDEKAARRVKMYRYEARFVADNEAEAIEALRGYQARGWPTT